jgi:UDP-N-acetylmuramoyl-L-alanyl-D-glutamate--2,6-diaminopimelate ligase
MPGAYNIYNAAFAMRAAELLGITKENIKKSIEQIDKVDGRFNVINDKVTVIIDYAHTISAFDNLLKNLNSYKNDGQKLILVFGCGGDRDKSKRGAMGIISEKYADKIIITSDNPRSEDPVRIIDDITKTMGKKAEKILNRKEAIRHAILTSRDGDLIAIVGKGPEKYTIVNGAYSEFDEEKIVRATLMERNK